MTTSFDFKTWCGDYGRRQKTITDELGKSDLDSQEALKSVDAGVPRWTLALGRRKSCYTP